MTRQRSGDHISASDSSSTSQPRAGMTDPAAVGDEDSLSLDLTMSHATPLSIQHGRADHSKSHDSARTMAHPYRQTAKGKTARMPGRADMDPESEVYLTTYAYGNGENVPPGGRAHCNDTPLKQDRRSDGTAQMQTLQRDADSNDDVESTEISRDPSSCNRDLSGVNSLETQHWSDTEGTLEEAAESEVQNQTLCRVSWCEHEGKRYGLCWAHGGVRKCCQRNCQKIALDTGEFCSIHEREVNVQAF